MPDCVVAELAIVIPNSRYEQKDEVKRLIKQKVDYLDNSELETAYSMICEESEDRLKKQRDAANALMELGLLGLFL